MFPPVSCSDHVDEIIKVLAGDFIVDTLSILALRNYYEK